MTADSLRKKNKQTPNHTKTKEKKTNPKNQNKQKNQNKTQNPNMLTMYAFEKILKIIYISAMRALIPDFLLSQTVICMRFICIKRCF